MKPVYLEFCGINSFSEKAQIDFKALLSGGVFGIFGDTGSGKSTILDSIHFALYGEIDRAPKSFNECINHKSDKAYVLFDFELVNDGVRNTYRVQRERRNKAGSTKAYFYQKTQTGEWLALAEGARDVDAKVEEVIGLTFADFKMCIALPQGDFAALVKSTQAERVKLVARLFNLERYGERLAKSVNEKFYRAEEDVRLVEAKMEENAEANAENLEELQLQIANSKRRVDTIKVALEKAEERHRNAIHAQKEKHEYDALKMRLQAQEAQLSRMQAQRDLLQQLPLAKSVEEKDKEWKNAMRDGLLAKQNAERATLERERVLGELAAQKQALEQADYPNQMLQITLDLEKVRSAKEDMLAEQRAKALLDECIVSYNAIKNACQNENFDEKKAELEAQIAKLGEDESLLEYINKHYKSALLADAYGEMRTDLTHIQTQYPQTQPLVDELLKKYTLTPTNEGDLDAVNLQAEFKRRDAERKALKIQLEGLEKRRSDYEANEKRKQLIKEQGEILRQNYNLAQEKTASVKQLGSEATLSGRLQLLKDSEKKAQVRLEQLTEKASSLFAEAQKQNGLIAVFEQKCVELSASVSACLQESGFACVEDALSLVQQLGDGKKAGEECEDFFKAYNGALSQYESVDKAKFDTYDENEVYLAEEGKRSVQTELASALQQLGGEENKYKRLLALQEKYKELTKELAEKQKYCALCDELRSLLKSNRFLEFIASEYLQEICVSASQKLLSLTNGRYFLKYDKEFKVGDNLDGGNLRAVKTLSGGETFLVSLSLALSLSGAICQKSLRPIEFFFLDEGFGTLDDKLVDTVMDVLGKLSKSFAVGLISHVEELKHRIDNKILVTGANEKHGSKVQVECY